MENQDVAKLTIPELKSEIQKNNLELFDLVCDHEYISAKLVELWVNNCDLSKIKNIKNVYYVGGTLCIDMGSNILIMCNLNEIATILQNDIERKRLLSIDGVKALYGLYFENKGNTKYFMKHYSNSWVRSLAK